MGALRVTSRPPSAGWLWCASFGSSGIDQQAAPSKRRFIQLLDFVSKNKKFVRTHAVQYQLALPTLVQPYEVWSSVGADDSETLELYEFGEPAIIDFMQLASWEDLRKSSRVWDAGISDLQGCITVSAPKAIQPALGPAGVLDPLCPEMVVLEHAVSLGCPRPIFIRCSAEPRMGNPMGSLGGAHRSPLPAAQCSE